MNNEGNEGNEGNARDWRPRPDPTLLTTEALHREIAALKELLTHELRGERELREGMVNALETKMLGHWHLDDSREHRLDARFESLEAVRVEQKQDTSLAIEAALRAQKEATIKSEQAADKQLQEIKITVGTSVEGLRREMGDLKERIGAVEQQKVGRQETTGGLNAAVGLAVGFAGVLIALAAIVLAAAR